MGIRRFAYWLALLALAVAWFFFLGADGTHVCSEARPGTEFGTGGTSWFPPGYVCLYIGGNSVEPFDAEGWATWAVELGFLALVAYGVLSFLLRLLLSLRRRSASPSQR